MIKSGKEVEAMITNYWNNMYPNVIKTSSVDIILKMNLEGYLDSLHKANIILTWNIKDCHARWMLGVYSYLESSVIINYSMPSSNELKESYQVMLISPRYFNQRQNRWSHMMTELENE